MPSRVVVAIVLVVVVLLTVVVVYGIVTRTLGADASLVALSTLLSGITLTALAKGGGRNGK